MKSITLPSRRQPKPKLPSPRLHSLNNGLLILIIIINGYIIFTPLWPQLAFGWQQRHGKEQSLSQKIKPTASSNSNPASPAVTKPNQLIIPSMLLDQPLLEGVVSQQYTTLNKGIWRWPNGSTPDKGSNTVLIGHRFTYTNPRGVFYFLNKVKIDDSIGVFWNNKLYRYTVTNIKQVPATDTSIQDPTEQPQLTLFTCTPLWLPKDRLVVTASLETMP